MAYIGRGTESISNVELIDNLTFDGSASYTLQKSSVNFVPSSANNLLISISGVVQQGNFSVSGSTITFDTTVSGSDTCDWILHYGIGLITTVADGAITEAKLGSNAVTTAKINDSAITSAKINNGAITSAKLDSGLALGKIGQVVSNEFTTTAVQTTSSTFVQLGPSLSITPTSTNSKILLLLNGGSLYTQTDRNGMHTIYRNSTNLGGSNGLSQQFANSSYLMIPSSANILDEPSTTSSITYAMYVRTSTTQSPFNIQNSSTKIILTAMEVLA